MKDRVIEMVANAYLYLFLHSRYAPFESHPALDNLWGSYVKLYREGARRIPPPYRYEPVATR